MITSLAKHKTSRFHRIMSGVILMAFSSFAIFPTPAVAQTISSTILGLPTPGTMLALSPAYMPAIIQGITIHPENPLEFDFIVNRGEDKLDEQALKTESQKLIRYFLASLTVPEKDLWVNLSPYEKDKIIPESFGQTDMGKDLLAQDYILKQLTASLIYPEKDLGKEFWTRVYKKAQEKFGTTEIPLNTFNKVWIVPASAAVYQNGSNVFVIENKLKVMLEEDYQSLALNKNKAELGTDQLAGKDVEVISGVTSQVVREVLIPELEKEVNEGKTFANLRQIYNSMLLATWYKRNLKETILAQVYVDRNKTKGVEVDDKEMKEKIYQQYLGALKKGVFDYIREDYDPQTQGTIPRKYFSGGATGFSALSDIKQVNQLSSAEAKPLLEQMENTVAAKVNLIATNASGKEMDKWQDKTKDEIIRAALAKDVEWASIEDWAEGADARQAVEEVRALLKGLDVNNIAVVQKLFEQFLAAAQANKGKESQIGQPQLRVIRLAPGVREAMGEKLTSLLEGGHASDRGIYLFTVDSKTLIHEFMAYLGMEHPVSVAFEMAMEKFLAAQKDAQGQEVRLTGVDLEEAIGERFEQRLEQDGFKSTEPEARNWEQDILETFITALSSTQLARISDNGRPVDLLRQMSESQKPNQRDVAVDLVEIDETALLPVGVGNTVDVKTILTARGEEKRTGLPKPERNARINAAIEAVREKGGAVVDIRDTVSRIHDGVRQQQEDLQVKIMEQVPAAHQQLLDLVGQENSPLRMFGAMDELEIKATVEAVRFSTRSNYKNHLQAHI